MTSNKMTTVDESEESDSQILHCPAGAILDTWSSHTWTEGIQIDDLQKLDSILVKTKNSTYEITRALQQNRGSAGSRWSLLSAIHSRPPGREFTGWEFLETARHLRRF